MYLRGAETTSKGTLLFLPDNAAAELHAQGGQ
jgi:hypothetical protein